MMSSKASPASWPMRTKVAEMTSQAWEADSAVKPDFVTFFSS